MHHIALGFESVEKNAPLDGQHITSRGLHGLLFHILSDYDKEGATWLHEHPYPKPFTMRPYYRSDGVLAGVHYTTLCDRSTELIAQSWLAVHHTQRALQLGRYQQFRVSNMEVVPGLDFIDMAMQGEAVEDMVLHFLSPTTFKQGPGNLPLPIPANVFSRPYLVWQQFAPVGLHLPPNWLDWCAEKIFVLSHDIQTASVSITHKEQFVGFIGEVHFRAHRSTPEQLAAWQALGHFINYCGTGRKTGMGMGAVTLAELL